MHAGAGEFAGTRGAQSERAQERTSKHFSLSIGRLGDSFIAARFCERLAQEADLAADETRDLLELKTRPVHYRAGQTIAADHEPISPMLILSGWLSVQKFLEDGQRQIFEILAPGDAVGLCQDSKRPFGLSVVALTDVLALDGSSLRRNLARRLPGFCHALTVLEQKAEGRLYEHIARLGRRKSYERLAHFICELYSRLLDAECTAGLRFPFPLTQEVLADFLGLTAIHVNRTLAQLRRDQLVKISSGMLEIENLDRLRSAAGEIGAYQKTSGVVNATQAARPY